MLCPEKIKQAYRAAHESTKLQAELKDFGGKGMERFLVDKLCKTQAESHMCTWLRRRRDEKRRVDEMWTYPPDWGGSGAQSPASLTESEDEALLLEHSDDDEECESEEECESQKEQETEPTLDANEEQTNNSNDDTDHGHTSAGVPPINPCA